MRKFIFIAVLSAAFSLHGAAQISKTYVPCNEMPNIMQQYYADVTALNRVYIVDGSPEKTARYKKLAEDYIKMLNGIAFASLPQGCKADYVLFKRDLQETTFDATTQANEFNQLSAWFPFA